MSDYSKTTAEQLITESLADEGRLALCQIESIDDIYCLDEASMAVVLSVVARNRAIAEQLQAAVRLIDGLGTLAAQDATARDRIRTNWVNEEREWQADRDSLHSALGAALALTYVPTCSQDEGWANERARIQRIFDGETE